MKFEKTGGRFKGLKGHSLGYLGERWGGHKGVSDRNEMPGDNDRVEKVGEGRGEDCGGRGTLNASGF